jgi:phospholipid transport system substrate-binding protein
MTRPIISSPTQPRRSWIRFVIAAASVALSFVCFQPSAVADDAGAREFIERKHQELNEALKSSKEPRKDPKLLTIFDGLLDYEKLTLDSMGDNWGALNETQQKEFRTLLKELIQKSYRKNLKDSARYAVTYSGESQEKDATRVRTFIKDTKNNHEKPLSVDYLVAPSSEGLRVRDVVTEEVSLVTNYRKQFSRILKRKGADGLLDQMKKQLEES